MATATDLTKRALRRLAVIDALHAPSAEDVQAGTEALNAMISAFETLNFSGDVLPLDSRFEAGMVAMLAVRLAEEYGKTPGPVLIRDAKQGEAALDAAYMVIPTSVFDRSLTQPSANYSDAVEIYSEPHIAAWSAGETYVPRQLRINGNNLYEVVTGGVSGSTGPNGTGAAIADGTVTWCWRRVTE